MFEKYNSIENHYNNRNISYIEMLPEAHDTKWVVTEKIHGTNFSIMCDGENVSYGKRSGPIKPNEKFYNYMVLEKYKENVKSLHENLGGNVQIFGEFAGEGIQANTTIMYGEKDFYVFDIKHNGEYLDFNEVVNLCACHGLKLVPVYKYLNSFDEVVNFIKTEQETDFAFSSLIKQNLPYKLEPPTENNLAEGWVVKPVKPLFLGNGSRVIIKCKTSKYLEVKKTKPKKIEVLSEKDEGVVNSFAEYINENRINNVLSKYGELPFGKLSNYVFEDAREEFTKINNELHLIADNVSLVIREIRKICNIEVRNVWLKLINN